MTILRPTYCFLLLSIWASLCFAQTPYDSFAPETSRPMLEAYASTISPSDSILCAIVADMQSQMLLLVDISTATIVAATPITDDIRKWLSVDPLVDKYIHLSPYMYCNGNPIKFVDPDGNEVKPDGTEELDMIRNTIPKELQHYVQLDANGYIDKEIINQYSGKIYNLNCLQALVNNSNTFRVSLADQFMYQDLSGNLGTNPMGYYPPSPDLWEFVDYFGLQLSGTSTGETGFLGKTLFPGKNGLQNSPNNAVHIIVNKNLSPTGSAEIYSHEANGHALAYVLSGENYFASIHWHQFGSFDYNLALKFLILKSKNETTLLMRGGNK